MKRLILILSLLVAAPLSAQDRPIAGSTVQTTDTSANSVLVGCAIGSTTCTGGIRANTITPVSTLTIAGLLSVTTFGTHIVSAGGTGANIFQVRNSTAGTGNYAVLQVGNDASASLFNIEGYSSTFTPNTLSLASGVAQVASGAGGLSIAATHASGVIRWYTGGTNNWMTLSAAGLLSVTGSGQHAFSAGSSTFNTVQVQNTTSGTTAAGRLLVTGGTTNINLFAFSQGYTTGNYDVQSGTAVQTAATGGLSIAATDAAGDVRFYAGGTTLRFQIDDAGNWRNGSNIMDSTGTPTIASGFGTGSPTIAGNDYAFKVSTGTGVSTTGVVNFGRTWSTAPVCSITSDSLGDHAFSSITTTSASLTYPSVSSGTIWVLCRSF